MKGQLARVDLTPTTFEDLFRVEYPPLVLALQVLTGDRQRAEDLASDSLARVAPDWSAGSMDSPPVTTVRRAALEASAPPRWRRVLGTTSPDRSPGWSRPGSRDEELWQAVRDLPTKQRWAVALRHVAGVPLVEVAAVLGCGERTAGTHLARAMATLGGRCGDVWLEGEPVLAFNDDPIEDRLTTASSRLASTRPDRSATRAALKRLAPPRPVRRRGWWITPELVGVLVGVLALGALGVARFNGHLGATGADDRAWTVTVGPALRPMELRVDTYAADFDGDGGLCFAVNLISASTPPARGCQVGIDLRAARPLTTTLGSRSVTVRIDPDTGAAELVRIGPRNGPSCTGALPAGPAGSAPSFAVVVACDRGVPSLYGAVPVSPDGDMRWVVVDDDGAEVSMTARRASDPYWLFETARLGGARRCLVAASGVGSGGWVERCDRQNDGIALAAIGSTLLTVDPLAGQVTAVDPLRVDVGGCGAELPAIVRAVPDGTMIVGLACRDAVAIVVQSASQLDGGPAGRMTFALEQRADASWSIAGQGSTFSCPTLAFCNSFGTTGLPSAVQRPISLT